MGTQPPHSVCTTSWWVFSPLTKENKTTSPLLPHSLSRRTESVTGGIQIRPPVLTLPQHMGHQARETEGPLTQACFPTSLLMKPSTRFVQQEAGADLVPITQRGKWNRDSNRRWSRLPLWGQKNCWFVFKLCSGWGANHQKDFLSLPRP